MHNAPAKNFGWYVVVCVRLAQVWLIVVVECSQGQSVIRTKYGNECQLCTGNWCKFLLLLEEATQ